MLIRPTLAGSLRSNRGRAAKVIRKADDLFMVMWLSKDTRETMGRKRSDGYEAVSRHGSSRGSSIRVSRPE